MTAFLQVGSPTVSPVPNGPGWLVDVGDVVPLVLPNAGLAYEVAAAFVRPDGRDSVRSRPTHATETDVGTPVAGTPTDSPRCGGQVSGPSVFASPKAVDGTDTTSGTATDVGVAVPEPNVLPDGHAREDYDFEYAGGGLGPIRLPGWESFGHVEPAKVWCVRHGWETEVFS